MVLLPNVCQYLARELGSFVFTIGNRPMEYVDTYLHLGHVISNNLDDENDIIRAQGQFVGQVNNVLCYFRQLDCFVKYRLFRSFCTAYYGCELWHLDNRKLLYFGWMWNKSIHRIWNLPYNAHCLGKSHVTRIAGYTDLVG